MKVKLHEMKDKLSGAEPPITAVLGSLKLVLLFRVTAGGSL